MRPSRTRILAIVLLSSLLTTARVLPASADGDTSPRAFFERLSALCGSTFEGTMSFPPDPEHDFAGKLLVAEVAFCSENEIRVPFAVGEDRSRTWIFTLDRSQLHGERLLLKHDHRHGDGTPDEITMYGGWSTGGTALSQAFPADEHTSQLIPAAATNVWTITLDPEGASLTYSLERHSQPRFAATLRRRPEP